MNVGLSRAREFLVLLASRSEMQSPYLRPLLGDLRPRVLKHVGSAFKWIEVPSARANDVAEVTAMDPSLLGWQILQRKAMRPVLSFDQQRLCGYRMDGKPRLVRGVAGSGKTAVLAHWLAKTLGTEAVESGAKLWVVYANKALATLLSESAELAWSEQNPEAAFPWHRVEILHIRDVLTRLLPQVGQFLKHDDFDYDRAAGEYLTRMAGKEIKPCCEALFVDEGQDLGSMTLKLLGKLVELRDPADQKNRAINIFYDNAQDVYGRGTPKWSEIDLNMQGRSTVMKESFRSTKPITEFAFNVLLRLCPEEANHADYRELIDRGLVVSEDREGAPWWDIRFTQISGPSPIFRKFADVNSQYHAIGTQLVHWIRAEGVKPSDICILFMGELSKRKLSSLLHRMLRENDIELEMPKSTIFNRNDQTVLATSPHSFKGYDSEIVVIPSIESFCTKVGQPLAQALYVAMTARTFPPRDLRCLFESRGQPGNFEYCRGVDGCDSTPNVRRAVPAESDDNVDILAELGEDRRSWLLALRKQYRLIHEPMLDVDGAILCEPLFWFELEGRRSACFKPGKPSQRVRHTLEDKQVTILEPGSPI